jgi:hypothetical protein
VNVAPAAGFQLDESHLREFFLEVSLSTGLPALVQDAPERLATRDWYPGDDLSA